ncbi:MAG TPA: pitrilysin family protein [Kofleriaceae bacterium]|nr:pitrilysin family protein [Kofleriaceae bacterium]
MCSRIPCAAVAALLVGLGLGTSPAAADDPSIPHERYTLPNGLEVILAPDSSVPLVAVNVWYHVGSGYEVYGKSGFAHLFEHMLFQGSQHVGEDKHFETLKIIGGDGVNGTTNLDRTNYFEVIPSNQLDTALWLESDRMAFLLPLVTQKSLDNQIEVVRNERRQRYDNVPYGKARFALFEALYPEKHPYRFLTIGKHEDLTTASLDDVIGFFKTWYVPANATLTLVGDFEPAAAKKQIEQWFGALPPSKKPEVLHVPAPRARAERRTVEDTFAKQRQITWAWHSPANFAPGDAELDVLASALTREGTGRLYKILVHEKQLATSVGASQSSATFSSIFAVTVTLRGDADLAAVEKIVTDELARALREPIEQKEIDRVVTQREASAVWGLESQMGRANRLQGYNHYLGDPDKLSWDLSRYRAVTPAAVQAAATAYIDLKKPVVIVTMPAAAPAGGAP